MGAATVAIAINVAPEARAARGKHAGSGVRRKADDDDGIAGAEGAEVEIFRARSADELHRV